MLWSQAKDKLAALVFGEICYALVRGLGQVKSSEWRRRRRRRRKSSEAATQLAALAFECL